MYRLIIGMMFCCWANGIQASYQQPWLQGFALPQGLAGVELVARQRSTLLMQKTALQNRLLLNQPTIRWIYQKIDGQGLPPLLVMLPLIESGYRLDVVSGPGAAGLWQLMPATALRFGVPISDDFDGRYALPLATDAALNYLIWLYNYFDKDWLLAVAAYNAGEGRITRAIAEANSRDVWSLRIPNETRNYVARLLALGQLLSDAPSLGITLPPWENGPSLQIANNPANCSLLDWANKNGISMNEALLWNPAWRTPGGKTGIHCPIIYTAHINPSPSANTNRAISSGTTIFFSKKMISLESLDDPMVMTKAVGLDMQPRQFDFSGNPDPLGLQQKKSSLIPNFK